MASDPKRPSLLAPSLLSADFAHLKDQVQAVERGGAGALHLDVMDGHFVPNLTIGPIVVRSVDRITPLPLDVHLMIEEPDRYLEDFKQAGADWISAHIETAAHLHRTVHRIREVGASPGVALNPATPLGTLDEILEDVDFVLLMSVNPGFGGQVFIPSILRKVASLCEVVSRRGLSTRIEVDGGVTPANAGDLIRSGADILVAGSAVFEKGDPAENVREILDRMRGAEKR
ncbi:MAG TPA: ribulose-phosphate 3-epimerase [Myxococcales bacterium]